MSPSNTKTTSGPHPGVELDPMSLRSKLLIGTIVVQLTVLAVLLLVAQRVIRNALEADVAGSAVLTERLLGSALAPLVVAKDFEALRESTDETVRASGLVYLQVDGPDGRGLARSGATPAREPPARSNPHAPRPASFDGVYHFGAPIQLAGQDYGRFYFGLTAAGASGERVLLLRLAVIGATGLAASLALQWLLAGVLTRRLANVARAAEQVGAGRFDIALPAVGRDEAGAIAGALRRMSAALAERLQKLQDSEQRQRSLIETMAEGMLLQDANLSVLQCNDAALRILGLERDQLEAWSATDARWHAVTRDGAPLGADHPAAVALRTGEAQRNVVIGVERRDGRRVWLSVNAEPLRRAGSDRPYATVTTFADITALIEAEDRLLRLNAELEQRVSERTADLARALELAERASRAKTEFLSRMSHDLRTPLNAILGFAQILRLGGASFGARESEQKLAHIEAAGWHLLELINDVLDLARIESGSLVVSSEAVALAPLVAECAQMLQPQADAMAVQIVDRSAVAPGLQARADRTRLKQVLTNLLSNAIKYNRRGGRVTLEARAAGADAVELSVADTGRGFTEAQQRELYQPFNRLGAEGSAVEGTGIGLVIAHRLTALMGGSLTLASEAGRGSVFTLRLPRADAPAAAACGAGSTVAEVSDGPARTVLYIEDNPSNVELLRGVLSLRPQWRMLSAGDGAAGIAAAQEHRPDLIVIDIGLPGIDGFQVCRRLRADPAFAARPIVALSANAMPADVERGRAAGFDAYLTKPLQIADFLAQADRLLAAAPRR